jgi:phage terminase large subunit-like protein
VLVFPPEEEDGYWDVLCRAYCPEEGIIKRAKVDRVRYDLWQEQGHLVATPGEVVDYGWIKKDILAVAELFDLREIGFDPWNATQTATEIMELLNPSNSEYGFQMVAMKQRTETYNEPMRSALASVITGKVRHGGHPVMRWCADNLVVRIDANGNVFPNKEKATDKIDLMTAMFMAWGRAMKRTNATSVYEARGVLTFGTGG